MGAPLTLALAAGENPLAPGTSEPWVTPDQLASCNASDSVDLASVCAVATELLFLLSGRKYGVRTETVRPVAGNRECGWAIYSHEWQYARNDRGPDYVVLKSPVRSIVAVKVDGTTLSPSEYQLYDNRKLLRMPDAAGNSQLWPLYQRMDQPDTEQGTFSVYYQWGQDVTQGAKLAAREFACQLAKYINRDSDCALPDRVVSITRQGVSQTIMDPSQFIKEMRTGLYLVDTWLGAVNPNGNRRRPTVMSPDSIEKARPT